MGRSETIHKVKLDLDIDYFEKKAKLASSYQFVSDENKKAWAEMLKQVDIYNAEMDRLKKALKEIEGINNDVANAQREEWLEALADIQKEYDEFIGNVGDEAEDAAENVKKSFSDIFGEAIGDRKKSLQEVQADFANKTLDKVDDMGKKIVSKITDFFADIYALAKEMLGEMAEYSENAAKYSQSATDLRMQYGLSGAMAYAYQKAAEDTGFGSFEGYLENVAFSTQETRDRFDKLLKKYSEAYEQDQEMAEAYQKFEAEFADFKKEAAMSLISFFMENKDAIKQVMKLSIDFLGGILQAVNWIMQFLGGSRERSASERSGAISDIYNTYGANKNTNIKIDNTFNNVVPSQKQQAENYGAMTYKQIIAALK